LILKAWMLEVEMVVVAAVLTTQDAVWLANMAV
jgi:hypothetical protein